MGSATGVAKRVVKDAAKIASGKKVTAFDIRFANASGAGAAGKMAESLNEAEAKVMAEPPWFTVAKTKGPLADGEEAKAVEFGKSIAAGLMG